MNRSVIYGVITTLAVLATIVVIITKKIPRDEMNLLLTKGVIPQSLISKDASPRSGHGGSADATNPESIQAEPIQRSSEELQKLLSTLPRLEEIPWQRQEIVAAFSNGSARPCRLLPPETAIHADFPVRGETENEKLLCQRKTAFLVGLEMDPRARKSLPSLSKATIENYLSSHALAIQPVICRNEEGEFLMTGEVNAAFFDRSFAARTMHPEPMIADAVRRFRVLGVLSPKSDVDQNILPRTVVMAFNYVRDRQTGTDLAGTSNDEYELLFLHLTPPKEGDSQPELTAFTTTDGRTVFQELNLENQTPSRAVPAVMASIRFDSFKLLGQYPADPVVTGLSNQIRGSLSVEELRNHLEGRNGLQAVSMERLLDEFHNQTSTTEITSSMR